MYGLVRRLYMLNQSLKNGNLAFEQVDVHYHKIQLLFLQVNSLTSQFGNTKLVTYFIIREKFNFFELPTLCTFFFLIRGLGGFSESLYVKPHQATQYFNGPVKI